MIFTCETWFHPLFPYFAYFHMWKQIFFTCVSHVYCMQFTCEILHPFTCEKWSLHVMGHISHENVSWSHVNRMWKTGVRMRKIHMRTACEILTRTDVGESKFVMIYENKGDTDEPSKHRCLDILNRFLCRVDWLCDNSWVLQCVDVVPYTLNRAHPWPSHHKPEGHNMVLLHCTLLITWSWNSFELDFGQGFCHVIDVMTFRIGLY